MSHGRTCGFTPWPGQSTNVTFSISYALSKFILDITDIGEGKHRRETWTYNEYKFEIANLPLVSVVINARAFSAWEEAFALQWNNNSQPIIVPLLGKGFPYVLPNTLFLRHLETDLSVGD